MLTKKVAHCLSTVSAVALYLSLPAAASAQSGQDAAAEAATEQVANRPLNAWGQAIDEIAPDPAVILGTLPNGMKYAIRPNATPRGGMSVRFGFTVGFAAEADDEKGVAHFIEHMAFNGSTNIPEGELVKKLERLGLAFGADTNASTDVHETIYKLDAPKADAETIDTILTIMRETASELSFSPAAVERERGVVLSEKTTRNVAANRELVSWLKAALADTPISKLELGGSVEVLKNVPADRLKSFYQKHYRPNRATLVVVGDFDPVAIEAQIKARFSDWKPVGPAGQMDMGTVKPDASLSVTNFVDPGVVPQMRMMRMLPYSRSTNSIEEEKSDTLGNLGTYMLARRLSLLALAPDSKVGGGLAQREDQYGAGTLVGLQMFTKDDDWQSALATTEQELRRALQFGFTKGELEQMKAVVDGILRQGAGQKDGVSSTTHAENLIKSAHDGSVFTTPETDLSIFQKLLPDMTVDNVNAAFRKLWGNGPTVVHISTKTALADPKTEALAVLEESAKLAVTAPVDEAAKAFAYDNFGKPGQVVSDKMVADLGIRTVGFANGVKLNIKKTGFETGKVHFALRAGSGMAALPSDKPGLASLLNVMSQFDGLGAHSLQELQQILAGRTFSLGLTAEADSFSKTGTTSPTDLELQLKLLAATVTDLGYRPETQAQWPEVAKILETQMLSSAEVVTQTIVPNVLANGDYRVGLADPSVLAKRTVEELKAAMNADLKNGPIEIALVGDVDEKAAIEMVARTFGALPKRGKAKPILPGVSFPADRSAKTLTHKGGNDQGAIVFAWSATDDHDQREAVTLDLLSRVFRLKLIEVVREKLGATYSPARMGQTSDVYRGYGFVGGSMVAEPGRMAEVSEAVKAIVTDLRNSPVSDDLLLRARKPNVERFLKQEQENSGWVYETSIAQSKPDRLERRRKYLGILEAITPADIQKAAQTYLTDAAMLEIRIVSEEVAKQSAP